MFKKLLFLGIATLFTSLISAQTSDELKSLKAEKEAQLSTLKSEIADIDAKITALDPPPAWQFGSLGTLGINFSQFSNWVATQNPNTSTSTIGFSGSAFANLNKENYFWRNSGALNIAKTKLDTDTEDEEKSDYETSADAFGLTSLFGWKLNDKFAISSLGEYRTTLLSNFNNPGYFDIGAGATWTPTNNMVVVFHPLNYNFVFAQDSVTYESSLGCKIVADYTHSLPKGIAWKSNLSAFLSYNDVPNLSNWIWINGFSLKIWKGLGVGFELGLRSNKQESYNHYLSKNDLSAEDFKIEDLDSKDNPLQTYWLLGFTYNL